MKPLDRVRKRVYNNFQQRQQKQRSTSKCKGDPDDVSSCIFTHVTHPLSASFPPLIPAGRPRPAGLYLITDVTQWVPAMGQPGGFGRVPSGFGRVNEFTRWKALRAEGTGGLRGQDRTGQDRTARPCCPDAAFFDFPALFDCPARSAFQRVNSFTRPNPPGTRPNPPGTRPNPPGTRPGSPGPAPQPPRNISRRVTSVIHSSSTRPAHSSHCHSHRVPSARNIRGPPHILLCFLLCPLRSGTLSYIINV